MAFDHPFTSLALSSTRPPGGGGTGGGPGGNRLRIGLGAAIVLLLLALGVTAVVTMIGQVGHSASVPVNTGSAVPAPPTSGRSGAATVSGLEDGGARGRGHPVTSVVIGSSMSKIDSSMPPAGWYQDPDGTLRNRWWSGTEWTPHFQPLPSSAPEPAAHGATTVSAYGATPMTYASEAQAEPGRRLDFSSSIRAGWNGFVDFTGFARRPDYWYWTLFVFLGSLAAAAIDGILTAGLLGFLWFLATLLPSLAITVRRLRDAGYHWAFLFLTLVPVAGIAVIVFLCRQSPMELAAIDSQPSSVATQTS